MGRKFIAASVAFGMLTVGAFALGLGLSGPRTVEVKQVGSGYTIRCVTERGVYPYFEDDATTSEHVATLTKHCLDMKIRPNWKE